MKITCSTCGGEGKVLISNDYEYRHITCPTCHGHGSYFDIVTKLSVPKGFMFEMKYFDGLVFKKYISETEGIKNYIYKTIKLPHPIGSSFVCDECGGDGTTPEYDEVYGCIYYKPCPSCQGIQGTLISVSVNENNELVERYGV